MLWILLSLIATFFWALTNLIDNDLLEHKQQSPLMLTCVTGVIASIPALLFPFIILNPPPAWILLTGILTGGIGLFIYWLYFKALEHTHAANVLLLWNMAKIFVLLGGWIFLHERLTSIQGVAVALLILSSLLTNIRTPGAASFSKQATGWMVIASLATAVEFVLLSVVFDHVSFVVGIAIVGLGAFITTFMILILSPFARTTILRDIRTPSIRNRYLINEGLDLSANLLHMGAVMLGPIGIISSIEGLQPLFVLLFAPLFKTKHTKPATGLIVIASVCGAIGLGMLVSN